MRWWPTRPIYPEALSTPSPNLRLPHYPSHQPKSPSLPLPPTQGSLTIPPTNPRLPHYHFLNPPTNPRSPLFARRVTGTTLILSLPLTPLLIFLSSPSRMAPQVCYFTRPCPRQEPTIHRPRLIPRTPISLSLSLVVGRYSFS